MPRGRHALSRQEVLADQRRRLIEAVPKVVARRGYEAMAVADVVKAAGVSRNAFYENFSDKRECFTTAFEASHGRLLDVLTGSCGRDAPLEERVEVGLAAALELLSADPDLARMLFVEAPAAGSEIALRHHGWMHRYGALLRGAVPGSTEESGAPGELDALPIGGIASKVGEEVLQGRSAELPALAPHFASYLLLFYGVPRAGVALKLDVPR